MTSQKTKIWSVLGFFGSYLVVFKGYSWLGALAVFLEMLGGPCGARDRIWEFLHAKQVLWTINLSPCPLFSI